jgi:hypothetical protein
MSFNFKNFLGLFGASVLCVCSALGYGEIGDYQLGSEWGKHRVWAQDLEGKSAAYTRAAQATAYLSVGATGFYLGRFHGVHVLATNHHVCPTAQDCVGQTASFRLLGLKVRVTAFLVSIKSIDFTLLAVEVPRGSEDKLARVARNFAFHQPVYPGERLMTFGFGIAGNPQNYLVGNSDRDCRVFSKEGDYRLMGDPDKFNPVGYAAWSFVHGCDISHGDSGSALIDRDSGEVVGILWTGRFPKHKRAQDSGRLSEWERTADPGLWSELNYGVPSTIIGQKLRDAAYSSALPSATRAVLAELIVRR